MLEVKKDGKLADISLLSILDSNKVLTEDSSESLAISTTESLTISTMDFTLNESQQYDTEQLAVSSNLMNASYFHNVKPVEELPTKPKPLAQHTNSIDENFFGEQTQVTKLKWEKTGEEKLVTRNKEKLGPIMIKVKNGNLLEDWEESSQEMVLDYRID